MNYHYIKNKFEIIPYKYPDEFDIQIYYLNNNYCSVFVKRLDSNEGWGLKLQIKIYDLDNINYNILDIGNSQNNMKINDFYVNFDLDYSINNDITINNIIYPGKDTLINNKYDIINLNSSIDLHIVIYYLD